MKKSQSPLAYPLPVSVDENAVLTELLRLNDACWTYQNRYSLTPQDFWDGIALYSVSGRPDDLRVSDTSVQRTPTARVCPYITEDLLPRFRAPWLRVVFYRLRAGATLARHRDTGENRLTCGIIRIHVPVITNPRVVMYLDGESYYFPTGTAWYFDATAYHSVENRGDEDRIHLVADFRVTPELNAMLQPLTWNDRKRLLKVAGIHYMKMAKTTLRFIRTPEGRQRMRARAGLLLGK
jgi:hypothetical protein